jgi:phosphoribosyl 1,2-cyclic phosphate phosphodiesterase
MRITVLGSGTSQGVPVIACDCHVCKSTDPKDNRLRASILIEEKGKNFVIDTGPDFRQQMLREDVQTLEAVIFTHEHKDHLAGLDDVRAFNFKENRDMNIFCTSEVEAALRREYSYVFNGNKYPGIPQLQLNRIQNNVKFEVFPEIVFEPIEVMHYKMPVLGFRIKNFAYITDAKTVNDKELDKLKGLDVLIVNALRIEEHISHFNLSEALDFIQKVQPKKAYLTHISHQLGTHTAVSNELPANISLAYDGLQISL